MSTAYVEVAGRGESSDEAFQFHFGSFRAVDLQILALHLAGDENAADDLGYALHLDVDPVGESTRRQIFESRATVIDGQAT